MADEPAEGSQQSGEGNTPTRPEGLPEPYWDGTKNALNLDAIKAADAELGTLRTFKTDADKAAEGRIAKPEDVSLDDLPDDVKSKIPEGVKWKGDPNDPLGKGLTAVAVKHGLTKAAVADLVGLVASTVLAEDAAQKAEAAATKTALGASADQRLTAARTFLGAPANKKLAPLGSLLSSKEGVEAVEAIITLAGGTQMRGQSQHENGKDSNSEAASELVGKRGGGKKLLALAHTKQ